MSFVPEVDWYGFPGRFDLAVAAGLVPGATSLTKFGVNEAAPLNTKIDVWDEGGIYEFLTAAQTLTVQSTDAADAAAGDGARTVQIYGLDANYEEINEVITLNGTTSVNSVNQYLRCNRMIVRSAGVDETASGVITAEYLGNVQTRVNNGYNQSLMAIWTVPAGMSFIIKYTEASIGKGKEGLFEVKVRPLGEVFQTKKALKVYEKKSATPRVFGSLIPEKSDIKISITSDTNNAFAEAEFEGIILDNVIFGL